MNLYDFELNDISGNQFDLIQLKGKKVMIVNTASECGYTPQYKQLQELHENSDNDRFVILGIPANNFGGQEPGSNSEIASFCEKNYGVTFPIMEKISVIGVQQHPLYKWLTTQAEELNGPELKWNFHKFLINENGEVEKSIPHAVLPFDEDILTWIQA